MKRPATQPSITAWRARMNNGDVGPVRGDRADAEADLVDLVHQAIDRGVSQRGEVLEVARILTPDPADRHEVNADRTVQGYGPGVTCGRCHRNSVLTGVWFWGYGAPAHPSVIVSVERVEHVAFWQCPACVMRAACSVAA